MLHYRILGEVVGSVAGVDRLLIQYGCAACGRYVCTDTPDFHAYLVREQQVCYCADCDPLLDIVPLALEADTITMSRGGISVIVDVVASRQTGVLHACLLGHNSTSNG